MVDNMTKYSCRLLVMLCLMSLGISANAQQKVVYYGEDFSDGFPAEISTYDLDIYILLTWILRCCSGQRPYFWAYGPYLLS